MAANASILACASCNSPHRAEIDRRLIQGDASRKISKWLKATHGVDICHAALANHKRKHLDVAADARQRIAEIDAVRAEVLANAKTVEEVREAGVKRVIANVDLLDRLAEINLDIVEALAEKLTNPEPEGGKPGKRSMPDVMLFNGACQTIRACVKDRHDITDAEQPTGEIVLRVDTSPVLEDPDSN